MMNYKGLTAEITAEGAAALRHEIETALKAAETQITAFAHQFHEARVPTRHRGIALRTFEWCNETISAAATEALYGGWLDSWVENVDGGDQDVCEFVSDMRDELIRDLHLTARSGTHRSTNQLDNVCRETSAGVAAELLDTLCMVMRHHDLARKHAAKQAQQMAS